MRIGTGAAALAVAIAATAFLWPSPAATPAAKPNLTLVYVGAEDCAPCRAWQSGEASAFRSSPEFASVAYREVKSPTLLDVLKDEYWPDDLRRYRDSFGRGAGVPLWLVVADQEVVGQGFGASQWYSSVLPKIRSLVH